MKSLVGESDAVSSRASIKSAADTSRFEENARLLEELTQAVPPAPINGYASLVNFAPSAGRPIHRWFWYREGFSQDLVDEFVRDLPRGAVVLDPFCGAGTSLLAAQQRGLRSVGFDVNPISILVSRVKSTPLSTELLAQVERCIGQISKCTAQSESDKKPGLSIIDKVFERGVLHALLVLRRIIKQQPTREVREFLFVAWLSILEGVSNVYKEGNGIKYKNRKRTSDGYVSVDLNAWEKASFPKDRFAFVRERLIQRIRLMLADLCHMPARMPQTELIEDAAENLAEHLQPNSISLAVFSPPYCNCFNYFKMYKVELWMGEFVNSYEEMRALNRRGLRSHVETVLKRNEDFVEQTSEGFAELLDGVSLWDSRIPQAVRGYFIDMHAVLRGLHTVLKPSARCVIVVGNSSYGGIVIPTDAILASIGARLGFKVEKLAVARSLTTSSQQREHLHERQQYLRESILILSKQDPRLVDFPLEVTAEIPRSDSARHNHVFLIRNSGLTAGTHKFHRYPAKFIPHVPRWALERFGSPGALVVDPFCGSGTTLVEASLLRMKAIGFDVDPIARLVSRVKTTPLDKSQLSKVVTDVCRSIASRKKAHFRPEIPTLSHWFTEEATRKLGIIRDVIDTYKDDQRIYDFLIVCLAAVIRRASNADNQTQKTYVSHTKIKTPEEAGALFAGTLKDYADRLSSLPAKSDTKVIAGYSALTFGELWRSKDLRRADMIVTSPPYLNSVDYIYNQMTEYFWIGDLFGLQTQTLQNDHKRNYIGTARIDRADYSQDIKLDVPEIDSIVSKVSAKTKKNGYIVAKYFHDMRQHLAQAARVLKSEGTYVMVVGDSLVSGEPIPVNELMVLLAAKEGFVLNGRFGYEIRNRHMRFPRMGRGGILRYDWVLELGREPRNDRGK